MPMDIRRCSQIFAIKPRRERGFTLKEGQESSEQIAWSKTRGGGPFYMPIILPRVGRSAYLVSNNGVVSAYQIPEGGRRCINRRLSPKSGTSFERVACLRGWQAVFSKRDGDVFVVQSGEIVRNCCSTNPVGEGSLMATAGDFRMGRFFIRGEHSVFADS